jgi:GTPase SAR1 family protein
LAKVGLALEIFFSNYFEGRVGKTSLTLRFVKNSFDDNQSSTIQATYLQKDLKIGDKNVTLSVWDTGKFN